MIETAAISRLLWELLEWHAGVEPISHARSRRTVQVAQHDHRLARLRIDAKNPVHSRSAAAVAATGVSANRSRDPQATTCWPGTGESCWESLPPTLCVGALGGHLAR